MKTQQVDFVDNRSITTMVQMFDAFKFKPKGRAQWLQRLAWRFLNWRGSLDQAYEPKITVTRHAIDADKFMERIYKQRASLFDAFHKEGQRLLIGAEDYADLMCSPEMAYHHFSFQAEIGGRQRLMGLTVEVIPWMRGAVVMPSAG